MGLMKMRFLPIIFLVYFSVVKCDERGPRIRRIVGGEPAVRPPEDDPVVFTRFSGKTARVEGVRDFPHYVFRGIRYAHPPVGRDRFQRPRQYFLQGYENATRFAPPCVQPVPGQNRVIGDEDCLFLNVLTPTLPTGLEGLPVIVWIHGGGFRYGSASQYGGNHLVGKRVVVVTIQYRLGSLGFLSTGTKDLPGNAALWDMWLAVQWVRNYIGFFGGNPHNINVMGHGSGASSAVLVGLSKVAKGLTSGIIAMSGSSVSNWAVDNNPRNTALEVAEANGCPTRTVIIMVTCLQKLSPAAVIRIDSEIEFRRIEKRGFISGLAGKLGSAPVYEGRADGRSLQPLVETEPLEDSETSKYRSKIPLLTGITKDETKRACENQFQNDILSNLKIPEFLNKVFVQNVQNTLGLKQGNNSEGIDNLLNILNPNSFTNYLKVEGIQEGISKIAEATGDILFNVPAFLTATAWSKEGGSAFLYRFEHLGKMKKGYHFLEGLPLIGNTTQIHDDDSVAHGDELAYIFDPHDIEGRSLLSDDDVTEEDDKVRDIFTQMISDFARSGKITLNNEEVKPFSITDNNFIQITSKPTTANKFRYCEMALWCGLADRLKSTACQWLNLLPSNIGDLAKPIQGLGKTLPEVPNPLGDISGKIIPSTNTKKPPLPKPPLGDVFGNKNGGLLGGLGR